MSTPPPTPHQTDAEKLAAFRIALQQARDSIAQLMAENAALKQKPAAALVGMACRFPGGAESPADFWSLLQEGRDGISEVNASRWPGEAYYSADKDAPGKMYTKRAGFLQSDVAAFDAAFFGISPKEARALDPQQRLLLEVTWHALEDARIVPSRLKGSRTGVFVGISGDDYARLHRHSGVPETIDAFSITGTTMSTAAGRLSYTLGLHGPCLALDTACSSSLVALHLALRSLREGECDLALVAGVNLILLPEIHVAFSKLQALSPDGACRTFDAAANGYVRSEGCAVVVLQRQADAEANGNRIHALVSGCAINQDGKTSGLAAPNGRAQRSVIRAALQDACVSAADVDYVEAHGTGTNLGDPIEVEALGDVMGGERQAPLQIGSVKSNIGHMEPVAGLGGLIKLALCLQHQQIPANLHFQQPNPLIDWANLSLAVVDRPQPWPISDRTRRAGLSSFGFSGTNAHVIVTEPPRASTAARSEFERPVHLLRLSARTPASLQGLANAYAACLTRRPDELADVCFSAHTSRETWDQQLVVTASDASTMAHTLQAVGQAQTPPGAHRFVRREPGRLAWLFTGQGAQYGGMGQALYGTAPVFRQAMDACEQALGDALGQPLSKLLFDETATQIHQTSVTQPALFAIEYALAQLWLSWGVRPDAVAGHSVGEFAAACVAGVFSLADAIKLISARGRLMQALPADGAMAAVFAPDERVQAALDGLSTAHRLAIAAVNHPAETVVSGATEALDALLAALTTQGIAHKRLTVSHAFHSPLMEPMLQEFEAVAASVRFARPTIPLLSNLTGRPVGEEILTPAYWCAHVRQTVRFKDSIEHLGLTGYTSFLEIGPHPVLTPSVKATLPPDDAITVAASLRKGRDPWVTLTDAMATLMSSGVAFDGAAWDSRYDRRLVDIPAYVFDRQRFWHDEGWAVALKQGQAAPTPRALTYQQVWQPGDVVQRPLRDAGDWLLVGAEHPTLVASLRKAGASVRSVDSPLEADFFSAATAPGLAGVVVLPGDLGLPDLSTWLCALTELLERAPATPLWLVGEASKSPTFLAFRGLLQSLWLEHGSRHGGTIDCVQANNDTVVNVLLSGGGQEDWRQVHQDQCRVARLSRLDHGTTAFQIDPNATYLITGGLGGLGLALAQRLSLSGATSLLLTSRSTPNKAQASAIESLRQRGTSVHTLACDLGKTDDLARLGGEIDALVKPLKGVFHLAGVMPQNTLGSVDSATMIATLSGKLGGGWALHELTAQRALDAFVLFGSISALTGTPGVAAYTAANAGLADLAQRRRQLGLPALCVHWGPWQIGAMMDEQAHRQTQQSGFIPLDPAAGFDCLWHLLGAGVTDATVVDADWLRVSEVFGMRRAQPLLNGLVTHDGSLGTQASAPASAPTETMRSLLLMSPAQQVDKLLTSLQSLLASILSLPPGQRPDPARGFFELGMESLTALEFREGIQKLTGIKIDAPIVFDYPTLQALTHHLLEQLRPPATPTVESEPMPSVGPGRVDASALSDAEIAKLIEDEFAAMNNTGERS